MDFINYIRLQTVRGSLKNTSDFRVNGFLGAIFKSELIGFFLL